MTWLFNACTQLLRYEAATPRATVKSGGGDDGPWAEDMRQNLLKRAVFSKHQPCSTGEPLLTRPVFSFPFAQLKSGPAPELRFTGARATVCPAVLWRLGKGLAGRSTSIGRHPSVDNGPQRQNLARRVAQGCCRGRCRAHAPRQTPCGFQRTGNSGEIVNFITRTMEVHLLNCVDPLGILPSCSCALLTIGRCHPMMYFQLLVSA